MKDDKKVKMTILTRNEIYEEKKNLLFKRNSIYTKKNQEKLKENLLNMLKYV